MKKQVSTGIESILEDIQAQLRALAERVDRVEQERLSPAPAAAAQSTAAVAAAPVAPPPAPPQPETITEEELLAISAALGAYFGVRVHIRQIRLISSSAWAQQGRVSVQASHRLNLMH